MLRVLHASTSQFLAGRCQGVAGALNRCRWLLPPPQVLQLHGLHVLASLAAAHDSPWDALVTQPLMARLLALADAAPVEAGQEPQQPGAASQQPDGTASPSSPSPSPPPAAQPGEAAHVAAAPAGDMPPVSAAAAAHSPRAPSRAASPSPTSSPLQQQQQPQPEPPCQLSVQCAALEALGNLAFQGSTKAQLLASEQLMRLLLQLAGRGAEAGSPQERLRMQAIRLLAILGERRRG